MSNVIKLRQWEEESASQLGRDDQPPEPPLKQGGGGGTSGGMDTVDAKIAAAEARTDTKFAELRGDLKDFATKNTVWGAVATAIVSILGVLIALTAFGGDRFDSGMSISSILSSVQEQQNKRDETQDAKLDEILKRLPPPKT